MMMRPMSMTEQRVVSPRPVLPANVDVPAASRSRKATPVDRVRETVRFDRLGRWTDEALAAAARAQGEPRVSYDEYRSQLLTKWTRQINQYLRQAEADQIVAGAWLYTVDPHGPSAALTPSADRGLTTNQLAAWMLSGCCLFLLGVWIGGMR